MRLSLISLAVGLLCLRFTPFLPSTTWLLSIGAVAGLLLALGRSTVWRLLALVLIGWCWACWQASQALMQQLPESLNERAFWFEGNVVGLPQTTAAGTQFELKITHSRHAGLPDKVRLHWRAAPEIYTGEHWRVVATLKRPHGSLNPNGFDAQAWLLAHGIGATGTVKTGYRLAPAKTLMSWRDELRQRLLLVDAQGQNGSLAALVVGDGSGLTRDQWDVLQATGTVHLMVISGQHIGMIAGLVYLLCAGVRRLGYWPTRWPWLGAACALSALAAIGYGVIAGMDVPVQRACLMTCFVLLWRWQFRRLGWGIPFLLALCAVLLWRPLVVLLAGFWLSFAAVFILLCLLSGRLRAGSAWRSFIEIQCVITLVLSLLQGWLGLPLSLTAPLANLIAVPWVSVTVPMALLGSVLLPVPWLGESLLWLAGLSLQYLFGLLGHLAHWQPIWWPTSLPIWASLLLTVGALTLLLPRGWPGRWAVLLMLAVVLYPPRQDIPTTRAQVWVWDVGQGLSVLVRTQNHALLYDAAAARGDFDWGERVVFPALRSQGIAQLDELLLSHADNDHAGGAPAIAQRMTVLRVVSGEVERLPSVLNAEPCVAKSWEWDGVHFQRWQWHDAPDANAASCVLRVEANGEVIWLTGDIDHAAELALRNSGIDLSARWLVAPHHGSKTSSSGALLGAVNPEYGIVSRGRYNHFNHPHPRVVQRYQSRGIHLLDTAQLGAIRIELGAYQPPAWQRQQRRFWREK